MAIEGRNVLVLGGGGMVGTAVCRELLAQEPAVLAIAARHETKARRVAETLKDEFSAMAERIVPVWGDIFTRAEWQSFGADVRAAVLSDKIKRRRLIADILDPLDDDILRSSLLYQMIQGEVSGLGGARAQIIVDCVNTATAVSYQDIYGLAHRLFDLAGSNAPETDWPMEVETVLAALSVPQLVRHVQILYDAMRHAKTESYVKVGTSGTGGMGFQIPYTHGEEKPSRLLLSKASLAGAQTLLTFLLARTSDAPPTVRELKPTALIGWHGIGHGPIRRHGSDIRVYDCPLEEAVSVREAANLAPRGNFGRDTGEVLEGVYIDTGENGLFTADEFSTITTLGQMELVTPEDIARNVVRELLGGNTGRDLVAALDGATMGPSFRGGFLRQEALARLRGLEEEHGQAVAYEILGPPRLSKLLYEAYLLKTVTGDGLTAIEASPEALADDIARLIGEDGPLRRRIVSLGIPILLPDGERLLRGPVIKSKDAHHGWVDLTPANMERWKERLAAIYRAAKSERGRDSSSRFQQVFTAGREDVDFFDIGEFVGWIFLQEEGGEREKS